MKKKIVLIGFVLFGTCTAWAQGFTVSGTKLLDANGNEFIMKGFSIPLAWYVGNLNTNASIASIKNSTGANCLRIVVQTNTADADWQNCVKNCIANKIIPIVELHDFTCGTNSSDLQKLASFWASKASFFNQVGISKYILIEIANEWGDWNMANSSPTTWRDAYETAITTIRNAGINTTIIIDAPDCGQDLRTNVLKTYGKTVFNSDSKKNILFSIHMYCEWSTTGGSKITTDLPALKTSGVPVIVGEFGWQENNGSGGYCDINETSIISTCESNKIGWLAWSWKGNNTQESFLDLSNDWAGTSLTNWGQTVVTGTNGTKTAVVAAVFNAITGLESDQESSNSTCYPNPFTSQFNIKANGSFSYSISDMAGNEVESGHAQDTAPVGSNLKLGIYIVKIQSQEGNKIVKVNKQ